MSRIASSSSASGASGASGVRVAAQPLSNVYTVLLLVAALAVVAALVLACVTVQVRYGSILPVGAAGEQTRRDLEDAANRQKGVSAELDQMQENLKQWPEGTGSAPSAASSAAPGAG